MDKQEAALFDAKRRIALRTSEIASLMLAICRDCEVHGLDAWIAAGYPFGQSLDEVADQVLAWRTALRDAIKEGK